MYVGRWMTGADAVFMPDNEPRRVPMRAIMLVALAGLSLTALSGPSVAQSAYDYPWCAVRGDRSGAETCYFTSRAQCMETLAGIGGTCIRNPGYRGGDRYERRHYRDY
jgi:hypothetical protein